jgi:hypothetical protein
MTAHELAFGVASCICKIHQCSFFVAYTNSTISDIDRLQNLSIAFDRIFHTVYSPERAISLCRSVCIVQAVAEALSCGSPIANARN